MFQPTITIWVMLLVIKMYPMRSLPGTENLGFGAWNGLVLNLERVGNVQIASGWGTPQSCLGVEIMAEE